jgi:hypothetical protein
MANTTLNNLLLLLQDNQNGDISGADMQIITTELWNNSIISTATDGNFAIFGTDVYTNNGTLVDVGYSPSTLPLSDATVAALDTKIELPSAVGTAGDILLYNGVGFSWETPSKSTVNLDNVNNTSDVSKPISDATSLALDTKQDSLPTDANGYLLNDGLGNLSWSAGTSGSGLDNLNDVSITAVSSGDALMYDGSLFINRLLVKGDISDFSDADYATAEQGTLADSATQIIASDTINANIRTLTFGDPTDNVVNIATAGLNVDLVMSTDVRSMDDLRLVVPHVADTATFGTVSDSLNKGAILLDKSDDTVKINNGTEWISLEKSISTVSTEKSISSIRTLAHSVATGDNVEFTEVISNPDGAWDTVTYEYTAQSSGYYSLTMGIEAGGISRELSIYKDGVEYIISAIDTDSNLPSTITAIIQINTGEIISVKNNSVSAANVSENSYISINKIS